MYSYNHSPELYHHGIKGMRWGVRRYQNKDGSLTSLGKARYSKPIDANSMDRKKWKKLVDSGKDFVVSKGQEVYRSTNTEYEKTAGKKYVSFRASDIDIYESLVREETGELGKTVYDITYSTNKNMRVAGTRTQAEILQNMYGKNLSTDEGTKRAIEKGWLNTEAMNKPISNMTDKEFDNYFYYNPFNHDHDILNKPISNKDTKKYIDELVSKGYDAVIDMVDTNLGYADGPAVVLKTEDSLKRKSHRIAD